MFNYANETTQELMEDYRSIMHSEDDQLLAVLCRFIDRNPNPAVKGQLAQSLKDECSKSECVDDLV